MDKDIQALFVPPDSAEAVETEGYPIYVHQDGSGVVEIETPGGPVRYTLKPLTQLYAGGGEGSIDTRDQRHLGLLMAIEEAIVLHYEENPALTDGAVLVALKSLGMNPEAPVSDVLSSRIQMSLRLLLSLNDYSRNEVRQALRYVAKSVERHSKADGRRGYLEFIRKFLRRK